MSMIFTKEQIAQMKFDRTPNKVLVKPTRGTNEVILSGGVKIYMDNRFGKEKHAPTTGIIIAHCGKLIPARMLWENTNEIQTGDYAIYSYESAIYAMDEMHGRLIFDEDGDVYFLIDYEDLFVVKRNDQVIPVNGYLLVSPLGEKSSSAFTISKEDNNSARYGTIEYIGTRNTQYIAAGKNRDDVFDFEENISQGDIIIFSRDSDLPLEYNLHRSLSDRSKLFFRLQRKDIDGIITPEEKNKFGL